MKKNNKYKRKNSKKFLHKAKKEVLILNQNSDEAKRYGVEGLNDYTQGTFHHPV